MFYSTQKLSSYELSSEVERVFSSTGLMVTDCRNRLKEGIIEAIECVKSWAANSGVVVFKDKYRTSASNVGSVGGKRSSR